LALTPDEDDIAQEHSPSCKQRFTLLQRLRQRVKMMVQYYTKIVLPVEASPILNQQRDNVVNKESHQVIKAHPKPMIRTSAQLSALRFYQL
jgi:hypothetical protein